MLLDGYAILNRSALKVSFLFYFINIVLFTICYKIKLFTYIYYIFIAKYMRDVIICYIV